MLVYDIMINVGVYILDILVRELNHITVQNYNKLF